MLQMNAHQRLQITTTDSFSSSFNTSARPRHTRSVPLVKAPCCARLRCAPRSYTVSFKRVTQLRDWLRFRTQSIAPSRKPRRRQSHRVKRRQDVRSIRKRRPRLCPDSSSECRLRKILWQPFVVSIEKSDKFAASFAQTSIRAAPGPAFSCLTMRRRNRCTSQRRQSAVSRTVTTTIFQSRKRLAATECSARSMNGALLKSGMMTETRMLDGVSTGAIARGSRIPRPTYEPLPIGRATDTSPDRSESRPGV